MVFGDSLSAAYGISRSAGWVNLMQQSLRQSHPQYQVINVSISGETANGGVRRLTKAMREHQPSIVILELGANDALRGRPMADIQADLSRLIQDIKKSGAQVILAGMQLPPNYGESHTKKFKAMYPSLAQKFKITLVPFLLNGITPEQFQVDNLHPTAAAQTQILKNVLPHLLPLL
jgi:acyl-CoA thioesterase I